MKRTIFLTSLLAVTLLFNASFATADENKQDTNIKCHPPICKERPKLYDKNGQELQSPPKPGEKVYDKNGNQITPPKFKHHPPKGPELNLTETQKAQADKMREASKQKIAPIRKEIFETKKQIKTIKNDEKLTEKQKEEAIKPLYKKMELLHDKADKIRQKDMEQFEKILTPEQKQILEEFKKTHKPHHREHKKPYPNNK